MSYRMPLKLRSKGNFARSNRPTTMAQRMANINAQRAFVLSRSRAIARPIASTSAGMGARGSPEVKCFDVLPTTATAGLVGAVAGTEPGVGFGGMTELNDIQQGASVAQRLGNKIIMKSIAFKCELVASATTVVAGIRCMLVYDRQTNGAFPAIADLLQNQPAASTTALSDINIANKSRFLIIRDQYFDIDVSSAQHHFFAVYCKGRWETEFGASGNTIGDIKMGAVYFICYAVSSAGVGTIAIQNMKGRIRYYD